MTSKNDRDCPVFNLNKITHPQWRPERIWESWLCKGTIFLLLWEVTFLTFCLNFQIIVFASSSLSALHDLLGIIMLGSFISCSQYISLPEILKIIWTSLLLILWLMLNLISEFSCWEFNINFSANVFALWIVKPVKATTLSLKLMSPSKDGVWQVRPSHYLLSLRLPRQLFPRLKEVAGQCFAVLLPSVLC